MEPIIASISLGAERDFQFRLIKDKNIKKEFKLSNGSLLIMKGKT